MNEQARYALIGAFILATLMASIWFVLWMGEGFNQGTHKYWTYFDESVIGLLPKAPVTFNGVTVGSVASMDIAPKDATKVRVLLSIDAGTPINQGTRAKLETMGLTGVAFVNLSALQASAPALKPLQGDEYPTITSLPSFYGQLRDSASDLSASLLEVSHRLNALLDEKNLQAIQVTLQNISKLSAQLPSTIDHVNKTLSTLDHAGNSIVDTSHSIQNTAAQTDRVLIQANQQTLPEASSMMRQFNETAKTLENVLQMLKQNPAMLVRGKAAAMPGPGELS
jgi:phospholipid/cholesterol/gamma-HCH transport system substrate-binding protein